MGLLLFLHLFVSLRFHIPQTMVIDMSPPIRSYLLFTDYCIYWIHRWLHLPFLYKAFHKPHHKWISRSISGPTLLYLLTCTFSSDSLCLSCFPSCGRLRAINSLSSFRVPLPTPEASLSRPFRLGQLLVHSYSRFGYDH